jgi:hypothetical protein
MEEFPDRLKLDGEDAKLLQEIKDTLRKFSIRTDLESIFTALNEYRSAFDPSLLSPALAVRLREELYEMVSRNFGAERTQAIEGLRQNLQKQIVEICRLSGKGDQIYETFEDFLRALSPPSTNDSTQILMGNQVNFFTTNYDLVLQTYLNLAKAKHPTLMGWVVQDGTTIADRNHWDPYNYNPGGTMLVPLHGSIELHRTKIGGVIKGQANETEIYGEELTGELLIYPVRGKYIYQDPFAKMFSLFSQALETTEYAIFVGFSFNDEAIRDSFISTIQRRWKLYRNSGQQMLKVVIYSPHAEELIKTKLFPQLEPLPDWNQFVKPENCSFEESSGHGSLRNRLQASWQ